MTILMIILMAMVSSSKLYHNTVPLSASENPVTPNFSLSRKEGKNTEAESESPAASSSL